jgi:cytidylate kinase
MPAQNQRLLITISRQIGSGGSCIGRRLSERLGIRYADRAILKSTTEYLGQDEEQIGFREERASGFLEDLLRGFIQGSPEAAYVPPPLRPVYDPELFETEALVIRKIADIGDCVIVGRGAFHVLRERAGLISVFLHAPEEFRLERIMHAYQIPDSSAAAELVRDSDRKRNRYVKSLAGVEWTDSRCYHLCINTAFAGFGTAEEMILKLVDQVKSNRPR